MGPLLIIICTVIWGTAFLFQKTGAEHYLLYSELV